jgi:hypothetical protein
MSGSQTSMPYQYASSAGADKGAMGQINAIGQQPNYGASAVSGLGASLAAMGGNSGYSPAGTVNYGNAESNMGQSLMPAAYQILNQGFDPQQQLYQRTQQQLQEQVRAAQSARGTAMSPYGAGGEADAMSNFNIDWQNNLLNRMNTAAQGAGGIATQAGNMMTQGQQTAQSAPNAQTNWFSQFAQASPAAYGQQQQQVADFLSYLSGGTDANKAGTAAFGANQDASNSMWGGIGKAAGTAAQLMFL